MTGQDALKEIKEQSYLTLFSRLRSRAQMGLTRKKHSINKERARTTTLKINLLSSLFSFVLSCLLLSSVVLSCLSFHLLFSLSLCLLSLSLSLSVSPCDVVCCGVWCVCVCLVCVWCVFGVRHTEKTVEKSLCGFRHAPVCTFKTRPCMPAPRAHVFQHVRVVPVHTGTF